MNQSDLFNWADISRRESNAGVDRARNEAAILEALREFRAGATGYELARAMGWEITSVRPRLTELAKAGRLKTAGRRANPQWSPKACTVYILPEYAEGTECRA